MRFHSQFLNLTSGLDVMYHMFDNYDLMIKEFLQTRNCGVIISNRQGIAYTVYALWNLQAQGDLFIGLQQFGL
ncbi:hypothetical protein [Coxiella-like endosymbiont]|uniref:hypothetical protein n=1 Tax=Coxiella-like endosymbiont TaxID=1592897 RepID=UPI001F4E74D1|nr:hypothetical protein [Coxiella-like endosymbiont]